MRRTIEIEYADEPARREGGASFVVGAVLCAAVIATLFTLHGVPDLLAGKLPTLAAMSLPSP
jgi:hypothetical protein